MAKRSNREIVLLSTSLFMVVAVLLFAVIRARQGDWALATVDFVISLAMAGIFIYVYKTGKTNIPNHVIAFVVIGSLVSVIWLKGPSHLFWLYPALIAIYYLFPIKIAIITSACLSISLPLLTFDALGIEDFLIIVGTLAITNIFSFIFMRAIGRQHQNLLDQGKISRLRNRTLELIVGSGNLSDILNSIVNSVELEYNDMMCSILLLDESGQRLLLGAGPSLPDFYNKAIDGVEIGEGVGSCGTAAFRGERVVVEDIATHPYWAAWKGLAEEAKLGSCWSEPITNSTGKALGTFAIYHSEKCTPKQHDFEIIEQFAHLASISIEKERASQRIWQQANFDDLTGLFNRNMMHEQLKQALIRAQRNDLQVVVAFLDLDNFKDVNDTLGHDAGDLLLKETASRIKACIRENDTVARLGGDEFVIIMADIDDIEGVERAAITVLESLSTPYQINEDVVHSSVSIGLTVYPDDALSSEELLKNADQAMYGAKNMGRNSYRYFTESMRDRALNRMRLTQDLRQAIDNDEFFIVYQPIVNLATGEIHKAEALLRWRHPERGLVSPADFVPLAEETGLIINISDWMFDEILSLVSDLRQSNHPDFQVSINTSPIQYKQDTGNITKWLSKLQECTDDSCPLAFEITENLLMENKGDLTELLRDLQASGISISIDDFGTGYSSLSYLQNYQADYLKIDISFVQKLTHKSDDATLCEAIVVMAKKLGIQVVAEGIETEEQEQILKAMECDFGQGYLLSKPLEAQDLREFLLCSAKGSSKP